MLSLCARTQWDIGGFVVGDEANQASLMAKAPGKEEQLIRMLVKKYGPEPEAEPDYDMERLVRFYGKLTLTLTLALRHNSE